MGNKIGTSAFKYIGDFVAASAEVRRGERKDRIVVEYGLVAISEQVELENQSNMSVMESGQRC